MNGGSTPPAENPGIIQPPLLMRGEPNSPPCSEPLYETRRGEAPRERAGGGWQSNSLECALRKRRA
jgi:hypothetical protein